MDDEQPDLTDLIGSMHEVQQNDAIVPFLKLMLKRIRATVKDDPYSDPTAPDLKFAEEWLQNAHEDEDAFLDMHKLSQTEVESLLHMQENNKFWKLLLQQCNQFNANMHKEHLASPRPEGTGEDSEAEGAGGELENGRCSLSYKDGDKSTNEDSEAEGAGVELENGQHENEEEKASMGG